MSTASPRKPRPLSPHLGIYRPQISSVMSILHRASGIALAMGLLFFVAWLVVLASGDKNYYDGFIGGLNQGLGVIALFSLVLLFLWFNLNGVVLGASRGSEAMKALLAFINLLVAANLSWLLCKYLVHRFDFLSAKGFPYLGIAVLIGWTWSFFYHFCCGIRHLLWDAGLFLTLKGMHITGWITVLLSAAATTAIWLKIWGYIP